MHLARCLSIFCLFIPHIIYGIEDWDTFKERSISVSSNIPGWCSREKAQFLMNFIKENKVTSCIEIGVFGGASLFPIARSLQYTGSGIVYAIDAWDPKESVRGLTPNNPNYSWWNEIDYDFFYQQTLSLIKQNDLHRYCQVIKLPSQKAVNLFADGTIDFIHFDGNHHEQCVFEDLIAYFPKICDGGYILLNDANWYGMKQALVFLLERAETISPFLPSAPYVLFRKNSEKEEKAKALFKS